MLLPNLGLWLLHLYKSLVYLMFRATVSMPRTLRSGDSPPRRNSHQWDDDSSLSRLHHHTQTHRTLCDFFGWLIGPTQGPLTDKTKQKKNRHPCPRRNSNLQSQQARSRRPTPKNAWSMKLGIENSWNKDMKIILHLPHFAWWIRFREVSVELRKKRGINVIGKTQTACSTNI